MIYQLFEKAGRCVILKTALCLALVLLCLPLLRGVCFAKQNDPPVVPQEKPQKPKGQHIKPGPKGSHVKPGHRGPHPVSHDGRYKGPPRHGHAPHGHRWVDGRWAPDNRPSPHHRWIPGHCGDGVWIDGHWRGPRP